VLRGSIACYPPVWGIDRASGPVEGPAREASLRTVVLSEAISTQLGASALIYGDKGAALCDPYYPKHAILNSEELDEVTAWRHFTLRCRDLFVDGEDTSWYEIVTRMVPSVLRPVRRCARSPSGGASLPASIMPMVW